LYSKAYKNLQKKNFIFYTFMGCLFCISAVYSFISSGSYVKILYLAAVMAALLVLIKIMLVKQIKNEYKANPDASSVINYKFYDDFIIYSGKSGEDKVYYRDLYKITENGDEYCIFTARNICYVLEKKGCSPKLKKYIAKIKKEYKK
ncbi:MAG: YcxB family protein, partial [Clostridiales bacterium]|nr:YcxB family protein [Clostridiales bacterium]